MHCKPTFSILTAFVACLGFTTTAAQGQAPCTLQTLAGTYAISEKGSSAILDPNSAPYPVHWAGALAPFVVIGEVTFGRNGIGEGFYWIRIGSFNSGLDPTPVEVTITELNADCTGKWKFPFNLLGTTSTIEERFVVFDNGREVRSVPTATGVPTLTWVGESHRISKLGEPLNTCGPQTAHGTYVLTVENLVRFAKAWPIFADSLLLRYNVSMTGDYTGTMYEKLGPYGGIELPASGKITVSPDCSFASTLDITIQGVSVSIPIRGVFFDEGKKFYALDVNMSTDATGTLFSFGEGQRIGQ